MTKTWLVLELTTACNINCRYCYNIWKEDAEAPRADMRFDDIEIIIGNVVKSCFLKGVTLAGGEPLLNKDLDKIVSFLKSAGHNIGMTTNGLLLTKERVETLIKLGVSHFEISLPTSKPEIFKALCGGGNIKDVFSAMNGVRAAGAGLSVSTVVSLYNYKEIYELIELGFALGANYFTLNRFVPGGKGRSFIEELWCRDEELIYALHEADKAAGFYRIPVIVAIPVEHCIYNTTSFENIRFGTCGCAREKWVVGPDGHLRCCEQNPDKLGNLLVEDFGALTQKQIVADFLKDTMMEDCTTKECFVNCGGGCRYCR